MKTISINTITFAVALAFSAGAMAESMSKADYKAGKDKIEATYKTDKEGCAAFSGNANDICVAEAKGKEKVARAELAAIGQDPLKGRYSVAIAQADALYAVANERCDDLAGNPKDVCVKEAKAAKASARADAKAQMKISDAKITANEKSSDARKDANTEKHDAEYSVAKEKCDTYSGNAKDSCMAQAKARFGKE